MRRVTRVYNNVFYVLFVTAARVTTNRPSNSSSQTESKFIVARPALFVSQVGRRNNSKPWAHTRVSHVPHEDSLLDLVMCFTTCVCGVETCGLCMKFRRDTDVALANTYLQAVIARLELRHTLIPSTVGVILATGSGLTALTQHTLGLYAQYAYPEHCKYFTLRHAKYF